MQRAQARAKNGSNEGPDTLATMDFEHRLNEAREQFHAGQLQTALEIVRALLESHGERGDTLNMAALCHLHGGDQAGALGLFRRAVAADPAYSPAWSNLGNLLRTLGEEAEGVAALRQAVAVDPDCIEGWNNLGLAAMVAGQAAEAEQLFRRALEIHPGYAVSLFNLGRALLMTHRSEESEAVLRRLLAAAPDYPFGQACLASALIDQGRTEEGEAAYRRELDRDPDNSMALNNLGLLAQNQRRLHEALGWLERAAMLPGADALTLSNYANVLREVGRPDDAAQWYRTAAQRDPEFTTALSKWMLSARAVCDWSDLPELEARIAEHIARGIVEAPAAFDLLVHPDLTDAQHRAVAEAYGGRAYGAALARPPLVPPGRPLHSGGGPLRIGYVSSDFYEHATMRLLRGVLAGHDPARVQFLCYSTGAIIGDAERERIEAAPACAGFRDLARLPDEAAACQIRDDAIDILVDLKGYTQENRLGIQALRPAPVVVSWLGYPGTLGVARLADYIIGDPIVTPLQAQVDYSEALALMPHCYQPNDDTMVPDAPPSRASQGLPDDGLVFCNFNATYKFSPAAFASWMHLLRATPGSVLWLLRPGEAARARLVAAAAAEGIAAERLVFAAPLSQRDHLARLQLADLALDTFPYTSHTTGSDALLAGVPLVTRPGDTFASRVAASLLTAVGLPDLIARDDDAARQLVLDLARDGARRAALRAHLLAVRRNCPLFDTSGFTRDLERLYHAIGEQLQRGERRGFALSAEP